MARFFLAGTDPHHLKDAPDRPRLISRRYAASSIRGKAIFAERCARCHSSKLPPLPAGPRPRELQRQGLPRRAGTGTGRGRRPTPSRRRCATSSWRTTSSTDNYPLDRAARAVDADADQHLQPARDQRDRRQHLGQLLVAVLQGAAVGRHGQAAQSADRRGVRLHDCPAADAASRVRPRSSACGRPRRSCRTTRVGPFSQSPSVEARMRVFTGPIEQMLWPERRRKDDLFTQLNINGPGVGWIQRTTEESFVRVPKGYIPDGLGRSSASASGSSRCSSGTARSRSGRFPKGTPVSLLTSIDLHRRGSARRRTPGAAARRCSRSSSRSSGS